MKSTKENKIKYNTDIFDLDFDENLNNDKSPMRKEYKSHVHLTVQPIAQNSCSSAVRSVGHAAPQALPVDSPVTKTEILRYFCAI